MTADRLTHEAVRTVDATVERSGPVDRPRVGLPAAAAGVLPTDRVVEVVLDGSTYRSKPRAVGDRVALTGAYDTPALAREPADATDRLAAWVTDRGLDYGRTVHLDVVSEDRVYGLRAPGETATYDAHDGPADSLSAIAERVHRE